jgi:hypothetical protein
LSDGFPNDILPNLGVRGGSKRDAPFTTNDLTVATELLHARRIERRNRQVALSICCGSSKESDHDTEQRSPDYWLLSGAEGRATCYQNRYVRRPNASVNLRPSQ